MRARSRFIAPTAAFTFIEVLAAMLFVAILMPVVVGAILTSNRVAVAAERSGHAVQLAENKLAELVVDNAWTSAETRGDFGQEWSGYRWELSQATWESGDMVELTMRVFFPLQGTEQSLRLSTLVSDSISTP